MQNHVEILKMWSIWHDIEYWWCYRSITTMQGFFSEMDFLPFSHVYWPYIGGHTWYECFWCHFALIISPGKMGTWRCTRQEMVLERMDYALILLDGMQYKEKQVKSRYKPWYYVILLCYIFYTKIQTCTKKIQTHIKKIQTHINKSKPKNTISKPKNPNPTMLKWQRSKCAGPWHMRPSQLEAQAQCTMHMVQHTTGNGHPNLNSQHPY